MSFYDSTSAPAPFLISTAVDCEAPWGGLPSDWKVVEDPSWSKLCAVTDAERELVARPFIDVTWSWPALETVHHAWDIQ